MAQWHIITGCTAALTLKISRRSFTLQGAKQTWLLKIWGFSVKYIWSTGEMPHIFRTRTDRVSESIKKLCLFMVIFPKHFSWHVLNVAGLQFLLELFHLINSKIVRHKQHCSLGVHRHSRYTVNNKTKLCVSSV